MWQNKIRKFMLGRYGVDELYKFLFILYIIILTINIFLKSPILEFINLCIVLFTFYRLLSKNVSKRKKENKNYLKIKNALLKPIKTLSKNMKDKEHIYKKCSKCQTLLKLPIPYERGIKYTTCPKCKQKLTMFVFKKQKIEIIKNKK